MKNLTIIAMVVAIAVCTLCSVSCLGDESEAVTGTEITQDELSEYLLESNYVFRDGDYYLGEDLSVSTAIVFSGVCKLDLNGYSITSSADDAVVLASGSLTVTDSSDTSDGKISSTAGSNSHAILNQGSLTIKGGTFVADYVIMNSSASGYNPSTTIDGGTIDGSSVGFSVAAGSATINGGSFEAAKHAVLVSRSGVCTIVDGKFEANTTVQCQIGGTLTINGGEFDSIKKNEITNSPACVSIITLADNGKTSVEVNGGTFNSEDSGAIVSGGGNADDSASLVFNNGTLTASNGFGICGNGGADYADITINGGTVTSTVGAAIYFPQIGDLTITGGDITGTTGIQYCGAGVLSISGGKITATYQTSDIPDKPADQGDGSFDDGAAVSIITRGGGYQDDSADINTIDVRISGGEFVSQNNSAVKSYRAELSDSSWVFGDSTSLEESALDSFVITGGDFISATGCEAIKYDSTESTRTYRVAGGSFNTGVEDDFIALGYTMRNDGNVIPNLIATIDGRDYYSFTEAVEAAKESDSKGFTLMTDIDLSDVGDLDVSGLTIDFDGHKVTADWMTLFFVGEDFTLKNGIFDNKGADYGLWIGDNVSVDGAVIENVTVDGGINIYNSQNVTLRNVTAAGKSYYAVWCDQGGNVTIESGTYSSDCSKTSALLGASSTDATMQINGGTFNIPSDKSLALTGNYADPVITGGTFNGLTDDDLSDYLADGYELGENGTVIESDDADFVAEVNGSKYTSFEEAVASAGIGSTVTLLSDATTGCIVISKSIDIDLGGYTLTISDSSNTKIGLDICGGSLCSIYNGTIIDERAKDNDRNGLYTFDSYQEGTVVTVNATVKTYEPNSTANFNYICSSESGATLILGPDAKFGCLEQESYTNGTLGVVGVNVPGNISGTPSTLEVNGAEIIVSGFAISGNGTMQNTKITINSGTIHSTDDVAIYHPHYGTLTIRGGTIVSDSNAGIVMRAGILEMNGGDVTTYATEEVTAGDSDHLITPSAIVFDKSVNYPGASTGFSAEIIKGTFTSANGVPAINVYTAESDTDKVVSISGGTFSSDVYDYCEEGFTTAPNSDGTYGIVEEVTITFIMPDESVNLVSVVKGTVIPSNKVPTPEAGYEYAFSTGGSPWDPVSPVGSDISVMVTVSLEAPTAEFVLKYDGNLGATITVTAEHPASGVTITYSAVGPTDEAIPLRGVELYTQLPGDHVITITATDPSGLTANATITVPVSFEDRTQDDSIVIDVMTDQSTETVTVGGLAFVFDNLAYGNLGVAVFESESDDVPGYGMPVVSYEIVVAGSAWTPGDEITITIPVSVPDGQRVVSGSAMVLYIPEDGSSVDMDAVLGSEGESIVFTTTHNSEYAVFYDLEAVPEDDYPFTPSPDDDYVPIPPVIIQEGSGDDTKTIAACAAAAVAAAILAILMASLYRRK